MPTTTMGGPRAGAGSLWFAGRGQQTEHGTRNQGGGRGSVRAFKAAHLRRKAAAWCERLFALRLFRTAQEHRPLQEGDEGGGNRPPERKGREGPHNGRPFLPQHALLAAGCRGGCRIAAAAAAAAPRVTTPDERRIQHEEQPRGALDLARADDDDDDDDASEGKGTFVVIVVPRCWIGGGQSTDTPTERPRGRAEQPVESVPPPTRRGTPWKKVR
jgi:hypothetical protein